MDLKMSVGCALLESGENPPQGLFNLLPGPPGLQRPGSVSSLTSKQRNQTVHLRGSELCLTRHPLGDGPMLPSVWGHSTEGVQVVPLRAYEKFLKRESHTGLFKCLGR